ncbi:MAG: hypothetical protein AABX51_07165 [Nanoarchaeota archaeon]
MNGLPLSLEDVLEKIKPLNVGENDRVLGFHVVSIEEYTQRQVAVIQRDGEERPRYYMSRPDSKNFDRIQEYSIANRLRDTHTPFVEGTQCKRSLCYVDGVII